MSPKQDPTHSHTHKRNVQGSSELDQIWVETSFSPRLDDAQNYRNKNWRYSGVHEKPPDYITYYIKHFENSPVFSVYISNTAEPPPGVGAAALDHDPDLLDPLKQSLARSMVGTVDCEKFCPNFLGVKKYPKKGKIFLVGASFWGGRHDAAAVVAEDGQN